MSVTVFGASGGTGKALIRMALAKGERVKAFVRDTASVEPHERLLIVQGDATDGAAVARTIAADDLVAVSLGNSQSPFKRLFGAARTTTPDICEVGTRNVIEAMASAGARRLVVVSAFGIGDTRDKASWLVKLFYRLLLREQMADKERQEPLVKASRLDWTIVQPVALTDGPPTGRWLASRTGQTSSPEISRADVAAFIVEELLKPGYRGATVTLSGVR